MNTPPTHHTVLPTHQTALPQALACGPYVAAIWIGLIDSTVASDSLKGRAAAETVRQWLHKGRLGGIYTGNRWIIPHAEIAAFLERLSPPDASKVAS